MTWLGKITNFLDSPPVQKAISRMQTLLHHLDDPKKALDEIRRDERREQREKRKQDEGRPEASSSPSG